ncbi:HD-GYP domain-containing protein [Aureimonas glaciei]|uniref:Metal-dependent phosphohydrolase n=1 Tax=Aureimonas glaciei TaxID=1776957 RepID=A0A916XXX6_9HYPH|nr:HD-GYP domain-containing protein [Aureimonas glaciei]GGD20844.1 metal-dependent phosphohydrolase [Aureimonas glaciei]
MTLRETSPDASTLRLAEIIGALSHALDMTDGQPVGHSVRCCWIGMHIGEMLGLTVTELSDLYYTLLLKDLGCSSNAARICQLYVTNDHDFKRNAKLLDDSLPQVLRFVIANTAVKSGLAARLKTILNLAMNGGNIERDLIETRCHRGADIARQMGFSPAVSREILDLDEHWNGGGHPVGLAGEKISLLARIALLAQVVDVFHTAAGAKAALREVGRRSGKWFDPELVGVFKTVAEAPSFWTVLGGTEVETHVIDLEPRSEMRAVDEDLLDDIADGFAQVIDAKSPYTSGHSKRVALFTDLIARELDMPEARRRWLVRAALLHDVGKLGVANEILDKPAKLDDEEWVLMRGHAALGKSILSRISVFAGMASIAGDHHEKLNGGGYPRGLQGDEISFDTRIVTAADIFDALTADRPYRAAMPASKALAIMAQEIGTGLDPRCFVALTRAIDRLEAGPVDAALGDHHPVAQSAA